MITNPAAFTQSLREYPGNEFRYICRPILEKRQKDKKPFKESRNNPLLFSCLCGSPALRLTAILTLGREPRAGGPACHPSEALGNTLKFHTKCGRNGYGKTPDHWPNFTPHAKNNIRWCASAAEAHFDKNKCIFLTGTLPGSTLKALEAFAQYSSWFMDCLQKWLRKMFSIDGQLYHLGVWELQDRGALHYHALVATDKPNELIQAFQNYWIALLEKLSDHLNIDLFERKYGGTWRNLYHLPVKKGDKLIKDVIAYAQPIKKSASAYLSKYLAKDAGKLSYRAYPPARWWSCTRALKDLMKSQIKTYELPPLQNEEVEECDEIIQEFFSEYADFSAEMSINIPTNEGDRKKIHLGWIGFGPKLKQAAEIIKSTFQQAFDDNSSLKSAITQFLITKSHQLSKEIDERDREIAAWEAAAGNSLARGFYLEPQDRHEFDLLVISRRHKLRWP